MQVGLADLLTAPIVLANPRQPFRTLSQGVLRVGTYFDNPPLEFISSGRPAGFDLDLMSAIARQLGLQVLFERTQWEEILTQMQRGVFDCIVGGITITPDRERLLAWSTPYLKTTLSLVADMEKFPPPSTLADLTDRTIGVQAATTDLNVALGMKRAGLIASIKIYPFARIADAVTDLRRGRIAAIMKVYPVAAWFVRETPGLRILGQVPNAPQPLAVGLDRRNPALLAAIDSVLINMQQDGHLAALVRHWQIA